MSITDTLTSLFGDAPKVVVPEDVKPVTATVAAEVETADDAKKTLTDAADTALAVANAVETPLNIGADILAVKEVLGLLADNKELFSDIIALHKAAEAEGIRLIDVIAQTAKAFAGIDIVQR